MSFGETELTAVLPIWQQFKSILFPQLYGSVHFQVEKVQTHVHNMSIRGTEEWSKRTTLKVLHFLERWAGVTKNWTCCWICQMEKVKSHWVGDCNLRFFGKRSNTGHFWTTLAHYQHRKVVHSIPNPSIQSIPPQPHGFRILQGEIELLRC